MSEWRATLANVTELAAQLAIFERAAADLAGQATNGEILKLDAVDELKDIARCYGFFGKDEAEIERIIGQQFHLAEELRERESVDETVARWERDFPGPAHGGNGKADIAQRFKLKRFNEIQLSTARNYLIKGLLPRSGLAVIGDRRSAANRSSPSIWACTRARAGVSRSPRSTRHRHHLAPEGGGGFPARVEAWRQRFLAAGATDEVPFRLVNDVRIDLIADHAELIAAIRSQVEQLPAVIFVDTLNRSLVGDENASADMGR